MPDAEVFDYGDLLALRCCPAGCDGGLLYAPVRFCPECGGSGFSVRWVRPT